MASRLALACAVALFAFPGPGEAQAGEAVARPEVKVGDRWTYRRMDYASGRPTGRYEIRVVFAGRGAILVVGVGKRKTDEVDTTYTADWNAVSTKERVFYPNTGWFRFPLRPGDTYPAAFEAAQPGKTEQARTRQERTVRVVGWEEVAVPAGKFRALKLESEGRFERLDRPVTGTVRNVIWYVPEVRRWVKLSLERTTRRGRIEYSGEELVSYALQ